MKRDLDLCRQLLADIEGHGPDCAVTALRPGVSGEAEEAVRYHLRLLIDAGFAKEVDRASGGVPCVRLTNAGHEMLELSHSEARWREAKWVVGQRTGTQSLTVIRSVLVRWATEAAAHGERWRPRRGYLPQRPYAHGSYAYGTPYREAPTRVESRYRFEREAETTDEPRLATTTPRGPYTYLERFDWRTPVDWRDAGERDTYYRDIYYRDPLYRSEYYRDGESLDLDGVTLPTHVV
ncbi:hypothetical protein MalM25_37450 [Planctomycetes bacterium MalM25]|nr:hypothetical protein MalM25_37450 [Planctomycetes bacterium MalM25]